MSKKTYVARIYEHAINFFTKGHQRSLEAKKNIISSIAIKGISIMVGLISVPLTIHYINPSQYGIWVTLSSMIAWVSFFDIGFTHGLRNKFAEAKAKGKTEEAKIYVSTAYYYISIIFFVLWLILLFINRFISWSSLLNLPPNSNTEISRLAIVIFTYFCSQFIFRVINTILIADQQPAKASFLEMIGQLISLLFIFILTKFTEGSLLYLGLAAGIAPTLVLVAANILLFNTKFKAYKPSLKFVKKDYAKEIMKIGVKFFVLQIAVMVQFESSLFLIANSFTDKTLITSYSIAYKYFFTLQMGFLILLSPFWSGVTYAYNCGDYEWIKNAVRKYLRIFIGVIVIGLIMLIFSNKIYELWLGKHLIHIDFSTSLLCYIYFSTAIFASIFIFVLNGIGAIHIQFVCAIFSSLGFVILALLLINKFHLGVQSVLISAIASNVFGYIIAPIQYYQIFFNKSSSKIWFR